MLMSMRLRAGVLVAVSTMLCAGAMAQEGTGEQPAGEPTAAANLPTAEQLFEKYVEAIGGREKMKKITSRRIDGRYVGEPFNFPARLTIWQEYPNKFHIKIQQPAGDTIEMAFDGKVAWERQPGIGLRLIEGPRLIEMNDSSAFWGEAAYEDRYLSMKTLGEFEFGEEKAFAVEATAVSGRVKLIVFSQETGLFLGTRTMTVHPQTGKPQQFETVLRPYEEFEGVKWPLGMIQRFRDDTKQVEQDFVKVQINPEEKHDFGPPEELKKLLVDTPATTDAPQDKKD